MYHSRHYRRQCCHRRRHCRRCDCCGTALGNTHMCCGCSKPACACMRVHRWAARALASQFPRSFAYFGEWHHLKEDLHVHERQPNPLPCPNTCVAYIHTPMHTPMHVPMDKPMHTPMHTLMQTPMHAPMHTSLRPCPTCAHDIADMSACHLPPGTCHGLCIS